MALRNRAERKHASARLTLARLVEERAAGKPWSYVDASSFALMESEGTAEAFAFDRHLVQRGLTLVVGG